MDVTGRKTAHERQSLLLAEIDHRAKNMLATVQAIVKLTQAGAGSIDVYVEDQLDRLRSLARTHKLLAQGNWERASLHLLPREELQAYLRNNRRGAASAVS
jgi:two-component sensor histidine kinase